MSTFADGYSRYLTNNFNYISRIETFQKYFKNSIISLTDPKFMSKKLLNNIDQFPKYPYFMNTFVRTDSVELLKIYNSTMDNTEKLFETLIGSSELLNKKLFDSIPSSLNDFTAEVNFQFSYISTPSDLYNYENVVKSYITEYQTRNFFSDLYSPLFHSVDQLDGDTAGLENASFIYQYMLYTLLYNTISFSHNIFSRTLDYSVTVNSTGNKPTRVDQRSVLDGYGGEVDSSGSIIPDAGFKDFVIKYSEFMAKDLAGNIGKSIYSFQNISTSMMQELFGNIFNKLNDSTTGLYKSFYGFSNSLQPVNFLISNFNQHLNALVSVDIVSKIFNDPTIVNVDAVTTQISNEDIMRMQYMNKITQFGLKNYLFLCFLYKFWPIKFLNVLQLTIKQYVEIEIKNTTDEAYSEFDYSNKFKELISLYLDKINLNTFLHNFLMPSPSIVTYGSGVHSKFTFTFGSSNISCLNLDSYNSVGVHDYIYADGDSVDLTGHIISKELSTLTLVLDTQYNGTSVVTSDAYKYNFAAPNYIQTTSTKYKIAEFSCINYYIYILEEYFKSDEYNTFVKELVEGVFTHLRDSGHIDYDFDWYEYHDIVDIYFKTYMRWKVTDQSKRCILSDFTNAQYSFTNNTNTIICLNKASYDLIPDNDYIFSESDNIKHASRVISHAVIGSSYVLYLSSPYTGKSTESGLYSTAYTYTPSDTPLFNNVTANFSEFINNKILINSTTDPVYDIKINIPEADELENYFNSFANSRSFIRGMKQFSENLILSTLTRETIYSVLSNFV